MIGTALRVAAAYVDDNASSAARYPHQHLSDEQRIAKRENIRCLADGLRGLADASETRKPRYDEYDVFEKRLHGFGFSLSPEITREVAMAFDDGGLTGLRGEKRIAPP